MPRSILWIGNVAEGRGDKTAFIDPARNLTYAELRDAAARIGPMLARMGIEPENRIALVLLDTVDFPVLFWGAIRAGIVPVLVNTRLTVDQYRYLFEDSRAKAVFVSTALLSDNSGSSEGSAEPQGNCRRGRRPGVGAAAGLALGGRERRLGAGQNLRG